MLELTDDNFENYVGEEKYVVVEFYTRWCYYCKKMKDEYEELFEMYKTQRDDILIARLEANINEVVSTYYKVKSYPHIMIFAPGSTEVLLSYHGKRTKDRFSAWIEKNVKRKAIKQELEFLSDDKQTNITNTTAISETDNYNHTEVAEELQYLKLDVISMKRKLENFQKMFEELKIKLNQNAQNKQTEPEDNELEEVDEELNNIHNYTKNISTFNLIFGGCLLMVIVASCLVVFRILKSDKKANTS